MTLPARFASIDVVAESSEVLFKKVMSSVKVEAFRYKTSENPIGLASVYASDNKTYVIYKKDKRNQLKVKRNMYFVYGRRGHFANKC